MATHESTVKWFDAKKGYGFLNHPDGGSDVFVHYTQITSDDDFKTLRTGQTVRFELNDGPKGLHALNVFAVDNPASPSDAPASSDQLSSHDD
jgi:CspA family cold shock protein